jgi:uncharacterized protein (DUF1499 family)
VAHTSSRLAAAAAGVGGLAVLIGGLGVLLANQGVVQPIQGFAAFAFVGGFLGAIAVILAALGLRATRARSGRSGRDRAWFGLATGGLMLLAVLRGALAGGGNVPRINDITTNPGDPPQFEYAKRDPATRDRDWSYPPGFAAQQRAGYPDLAPIALSVPPDDAYERAQAAVHALGFDVVLSDKARGVIEARDTTKLFHFVDDVAIRIRPDANGGSVVDIRSKSRVGKGDIGANAKRIRAIEAELRKTT